MVVDRRALKIGMPIGLAGSLLLALTSPGLGASPGTNPFTSAVMHFNPDSGTIESVQASSAPKTPAALFYFICWTPGDSETNTQTTGSLTVAADGTLNGTCTATRADASGNGFVTSVTKQGTLTGRFDLATQRVQFHLEAHGTYIDTGPDCDQCHWVDHAIVVDGPISGGDVVGDRAEGRARFTYTCSVKAKTQCGINTMTATVDFAIQFLPQLSTQAGGGGGGTTQGGPTTGSPGGLEELGGLVPLLLLIILLLFAAWLLYRRVF